MATPGFEFTDHQAKFFADQLTRRAPNSAERLSMSLFDAAVDLNPHQIEATLFALHSPISKGAILAGTSPDGQRVLVIWRKRPSGETPEGLEQDNAALDHWFNNKQQYSVRDSEFDVIYVNGDNNLENLKRSDETWKVRLIEKGFHRLMFDTDGLP